LKSEGIRCVELHGDKTQNYRDRSLDLFKNGIINVLIATDVASRGLDIKNIDYVINFDMPQTIENYIHRIGRTGRAGNKGKSISFFTNNDIPLASDLVNVLNLSKQPIPEQLKNILANQLQEKRNQLNVYNMRRGYNQRGYNQRGNNQRDYNQRGNNQRGNYQRDYNQRGNNQRDYNQRGNNQRGYNNVDILSDIFKEDDPLNNDRNTFNKEKSTFSNDRNTFNNDRNTFNRNNERNTLNNDRDNFDKEKIPFEQ